MPFLVVVSIHCGDVGTLSLDDIFHDALGSSPREGRLRGDEIFILGWRSDRETPPARSIATDEPAVPVSSIDFRHRLLGASHLPTRRPWTMKSDPNKGDKIALLSPQLHGQ